MHRPGSDRRATGAMMRPVAVPPPRRDAAAMHTRQVVPFLVLLLAATTGAAAQGRGRGRAEEITNRIGAFFVDVKGPLPKDDQAGDLAQTELVRAAAALGQPAVLYLVDASEADTVREQFERTLFGDDELGIMLRCFHCGRVDLRAEPLLAEKFRQKAPLFVAFDKDGKAGEIVAMSGYKPAAKALEQALATAARGTVKPSLAAFAKDYAGLVRDLEQVLARKQTARERSARAGADKAKKSDAEKDLAAIEKEEQKLLDRERELLGKVALPVRPAGARRLGGRGFGEAGRGGDGNGRGNGGGPPAPGN